jgi:hypothetical protein
MKKYIVLLFAVITLPVAAQEFESGEEALTFLNQHFKGSTYVKAGDTWTDPVELIFDINEINIFSYRGTLQEQYHNDFTKDKTARLVPDRTVEGIVFFTWTEVINIDLQLKNGQYWIVINGPVYNDKSEPVAENRTLYVAEKDQAQQIKAALEYCLLEYGG